MDKENNLILVFDRFDIVGGTFGGYYSPTKLTLQIIAGVLRNLPSCLCSLPTRYSGRYSAT